MEKLYTQTKARYVTGQLEKGEEGTLHYQIFVNYKNSIRATCLKKFDSKLHIKVVNRDNGAGDYCNKVDTRVDGPWTFGEKPIRRNNKVDWEEIYN